MSISKRLLLLTTLLLPAFVYTVDRSNFKTCKESSFCRRQRAVQPGESPYTILLDSLSVTETGVFAIIVNQKNQVQFIIEFYPCKNNILRIKINEKKPLHPRFEEPYTLLRNIETERFEVTDKTIHGFTIKYGESRAVITSWPLVIDVYYKSDPTITINGKGLLKFEHYRHKHGGETEEGNEENQEIVDDEPDKDGLWEETFKSHTDSKPRGPSSIGVDISFLNYKHVYGIPMHADSFSLKETTSSDPYRLYNLDVFEYELNNQMAVYGSVPVMIAHSTKHTSGVFWHNAAETWVDIQKLPRSNVVSSITGFFSGGEAEIPQVSTHWMAESGIIDLFVMSGPRPMDVFQQYGSLTGHTNLPPMFSLGYHQCRWNYNDQDDVRQVHDNFDLHDLPFDVLWLDIEHTDGKRYFTWDQNKFHNPIEMTANLTARGRKLVTIIDPHIKRDENYFFYKENHDLNYFVKNKDGTEFEGWCWPGSSSYIDFTNTNAREHYINTYNLNRYKGSTLDTFTWNDMNEPSVFNGPEITMQKDLIHPGLNIEHREVHNVVALLYHAATYEGHLRRSNGHLRPFVLTRGHYAGTQRTAAVWTGDNTADWGHLAMSVPMCLSLSVVGITHVGADVGGFFGNPDAFLLARWYQAAAYQPFFRAHAHLDTKRREPWLFDVETLNIIRESLKARYRMLAYWYTLFYENELTGAPPMRPLWVEFPSEEDTFNIDNEYMIGSALLVHPVVTQGASTAAVYFPQGNWYDIDDHKKYNGPNTHTVPAPRHKIPVYQRGGTIIPRKERVRRASILMRDDPYTLIIVLDSDGRAQGQLYMDDEHTFEYRTGKFLYIGFSFKGGVLSSQLLDPSGTYETKSWLERVVIIGLTYRPGKVVMNSSGTGQITLEHHIGKDDGPLVIRKPGINMKEEFTITLH